MYDYDCVFECVHVCMRVRGHRSAYDVDVSVRVHVYIIYVYVGGS